MKSTLLRLIHHHNLSSAECEAVIDEILANANTAQIAAFLALLQAKQPTADELFGLVTGMHKHMNPISISGPLLDIVGTGGDGVNTVNISTAASIVAASCGAKVAKHGNRSVTSACGSADLLESYGIRIDMNAKEVASCVNEVGIGFCFAPQFHPVMLIVKPIRNALNIPTIFNLMGPLLNPAQAQHYLLGVANPDHLSLLAEVLLKLKVNHALVVHSAGLDELTLLAPAQAIEVTNTGMRSLVIDPCEYGFMPGCLADIEGGDAKENKNRLQTVFAGEPSILADTIAFNAGAALYAVNLAATIAQGIALAKLALQNGAAQRLLRKWQQIPPTPLF